MDNEGRTVAAFFDLDGTLYDGHLWKALTRHHWRHRVKRPWVAFFLATRFAAWPLVSMGLWDQESFFRWWGEGMTGYVAGFDEERATQLFRWVWENEMAPSLRAEVVDVLRRHQSQGHATVIVSGTFQDQLEVIAAGLGVPYAVGTPLERRDGRYTGRIVPPFCMGRHKVERVRAFLADSELQVDLAASYAYADTIHDRLILDMVGHPAAVCPDEGLRVLAQEKGWPVIGQPKSEAEK